MKRGKTVKNEIFHFFAVWKKRGKSFFATVFPHICGENAQCLTLRELSLPQVASEVIYDSEVHFVSEVSPCGEVTGKLNFTASLYEQLHKAEENY